MNVPMSVVIGLLRAAIKAQLVAYTEPTQEVEVPAVVVPFLRQMVASHPEPVVLQWATLELDMIEEEEACPQ